VIAAAELGRALADPGALHGITQLMTSWAAAFVLDPDGVTKTTALGCDRMSRRLDDALPDGDHRLRAAVWALMPPMISPRLAARNADAFPAEEAPRSPSTRPPTAVNRRSTTSTSQTKTQRQRLPSAHPAASRSPGVRRPPPSPL
jgi:hypothetical protein